MKFRVRFHIDFEVEAEDEDEALSEAEAMVIREFEQHTLGITEILDSQIEVIE